MLASAGVAQAQSKLAVQARPSAAAAAPLKVLWWQGATLLNPHFATGTKDQDGSRIFYEPLASWDPDGNLVPMLAAEIPSVQNGGVAKDGTSVTWKLKKGVKWHDGKPFTADDVRVQLGVRAPIRPRPRSNDRHLQGHRKVDKVDSHTDQGHLQEADALLGRRLLRRATA